MLPHNGLGEEYVLSNYILLLYHFQSQSWWTNLYSLTDIIFLFRQVPVTFTLTFLAIINDTFLSSRGGILLIRI